MHAVTLSLVEVNMGPITNLFPIVQEDVRHRIPLGRAAVVALEAVVTGVPVVWCAILHRASLVMFTFYGVCFHKTPLYEHASCTL